MQASLLSPQPEHRWTLPMAQANGRSVGQHRAHQLAAFSPNQRKTALAIPGDRNTC